MLKVNQDYKIELLADMEIIQSTKKDPQKFNRAKGDKFVGRYIISTVSGYHSFFVNDFLDEVFFKGDKIKLILVK